MMATNDIDKAWALVIGNNATSRSVMAARCVTWCGERVKQTAGSAMRG